MAKKMKKYQGDAGSSSVNPVDYMQANVKLANDKAAKQAANRNKNSTAPASLFRTPSTRFSDAAKRAVTNLAVELRKAKKGGAMKSITALDQVDKMYKAKYKK